MRRESSRLPNRESGYDLYKGKHLPSVALLNSLDLRKRLYSEVSLSILYLYQHKLIRYQPNGFMKLGEILFIFIQSRKLNCIPEFQRECF